MRVCLAVRVCPGVRVWCWCELCLAVRVCLGVKGVHVDCRAQGGKLLFIALSELESPSGLPYSRLLSPEILFVKDEKQDCC